MVDLGLMITSLNALSSLRSHQILAIKIVTASDTPKMALMPAMVDMGMITTGSNVVILQDQDLRRLESCTNFQRFGDANDSADAGNCGHGANDDGSEALSKWILRMPSISEQPSKDSPPRARRQWR